MTFQNEREKWLLTFIMLALLSTSFDCNIWRGERKGSTITTQVIMKQSQLNALVLCEIEYVPRRIVQ